MVLSKSLYLTLILSSSTLDGLLFGDGNTNFENFSAEHSCTGNHFCTFYQLLPPVHNSMSPLATKKPSIEASDSSFPQSDSYSGLRTAPMDLSQD